MELDNEESSNNKGNYNKLKENAEALLQLVDKYVKVQLIKETEFYGFVHSIDPLQHSIILLVPEEDSCSINIIPGYAILEVAEAHPIPKFKPPERIMVTLLSSEDTMYRKEKLVSWFKRNLLPITEQKGKIIFGSVSILPPYDVSNICTDNPVVALQVRKIIENMPPDFDPNK